jgi:hypothetical protein
MESTVITAIATQVERLHRIEGHTAHPNYAANKQDARRRIAHYEREHMPHGSGYDNGCEVDISRSTPSKIVIRCPFHHMDEHGYYDGWEHYVATVKPSFLGDGMDIHVTGGRKQHRDLIAEQVGYDLAQIATEPQ